MSFAGKKGMERIPADRKCRIMFENELCPMHPLLFAKLVGPSRSIGGDTPLLKEIQRRRPVRMEMRRYIEYHRLMMPALDRIDQRLELRCIHGAVDHH